MTDFCERSRSGSGDRDDYDSREESGFESIESTLTLAPQAALTSRWCVWGMHNIYKEDILQDNWGR